MQIVEIVKPTDTLWQLSNAFVAELRISFSDTQSRVTKWLDARGEPKNERSGS